MISSGSRVRLGVLTRTYGLAGGIRLAVDGDAVPTVAAPCEAWIGYSAAFVEPIRLERCERRGNEMTCYFVGIRDRNAAEPLLDRALFLPADMLSYNEPLSNPMLIGYEVRDEAGEHLGLIASIFKTPAHFIWQVESGQREWMMPAINRFIAEIRHDERIAIVRPIPGMVTEEPEHDEDQP